MPTWAKQCQAAGLYVAMPTTATSNQMHDRTRKFLSKQMGETVTPLLVHSQALLRDLPEQDDPVEEDDGDAAAAQAWFLPRKKSLLAPYGVGTVDQALMSVLQTKHFFVRLLGLSHKVVIFDEVHAYDAYMSELVRAAADVAAGGGCFSDRPLGHAAGEDAAEARGRVCWRVASRHPPAAIHG